MNDLSGETFGDIVDGDAEMASGSMGLTSMPLITANG